jgi:DNA-binding Lrp family transcriptional regulator
VRNDGATRLDELDLRILERYQHDTLVPARAIGDAVGLSTAAVQRRLKRMREIGVIQREVAEIAPKSVGRPVTCIVAVSLHQERAADLARFKRKVKSLPEVQQCYYVTGEADFILVVLVSGMEEFDAFTRRDLLDDENVRSFTTSVALERVKTGVAVPISRR